MDNTNPLLNQVRERSIPTAAAAAATPTPTATHMGTPGGAAGGEAAEGCGGFSGTAALVAGAGGSADGDAGPCQRERQQQWPLPSQ